MQYNYLQGAIGRYRLTMSQRFKVWNDDDFNRAMNVREQLGIHDPLTKFCKHCGLEYSESIFGRLNELFTKYEQDNNIQA